MGRKVTCESRLNLGRITRSVNPVYFENIHSLLGDVLFSINFVEDEIPVGEARVFEGIFKGTIEDFCGITYIIPHILRYKVFEKNIKIGHD